MLLHFTKTTITLLLSLVYHLKYRFFSLLIITSSRLEITIISNTTHLSYCGRYFFPSLQVTIKLSINNIARTIHSGIQTNRYDAIVKPSSFKHKSIIKIIFNTNIPISINLRRFKTLKSSITVGGSPRR